MILAALWTEAFGWEPWSACVCICFKKCEWKKKCKVLISPVKKVMFSYMSVWLYVGWLVCRQAYTKSTQQIDMQLGWRMGLGPEWIPFHFWCGSELMEGSRNFLYIERFFKMLLISYRIIYKSWWKKKKEVYLGGRYPQVTTAVLYMVKQLWEVWFIL